MRFNGGQGDGIDDVLHQGASAQGVDRPVEPLKHRSDRHGAGGALHCLVADVPRIEIREHEHGDIAGDRVAEG